jgi:hypothetical protein
MKAPVTYAVQAISTRLLFLITLAMVLLGITYGIRDLGLLKRVGQWATRPYIMSVS